MDVGLMLGCSVDLNEKRKYLKIMEDGTLGFKPIDNMVFKNFMLQNPEYLWETPVQVEYEMWDKELSLTGTADLIVIKDKKLSLCDWKTASSYGRDKRDQYFKQLAAYSLMWERKGFEPISELCIFPLNPKNKQGYGTPIITIEVKKYQEMFMKDYKEFISLTK